jgi:hypothetical protein
VYCITCAYVYYGISLAEVREGQALTAHILRRWQNSSVPPSMLSEHLSVLPAWPLLRASSLLDVDWDRRLVHCGERSKNRSRGARDSMSRIFGFDQFQLVTLLSLLTTPVTD